LSILVALTLVVFALGAVFVPTLVPHLPWAGVLAGVLALLQAVNLRTAAPPVRWGLTLAGGVAVVLMLAVLAVRP